MKHCFSVNELLQVHCLCSLQSELLLHAKKGDKAIDNSLWFSKDQYKRIHRDKISRSWVTNFLSSSLSWLIVSFMQ